MSPCRTLSPKGVTECRISNPGSTFLLGAVACVDERESAIPDCLFQPAVARPCMSDLAGPLSDLYHAKGARGSGCSACADTLQERRLSPPDGREQDDKLGHGMIRLLGSRVKAEWTHDAKHVRVLAGARMTLPSRGESDSHERRWMGWCCARSMHVWGNCVGLAAMRLAFVAESEQGRLRTAGLSRRCCIHGASEGPVHMQVADSHTAAGPRSQPRPDTSLAAAVNFRPTTPTFVTRGREESVRVCKACKPNSPVFSALLLCRRRGLSARESFRSPLHEQR